jgi:cytochrome P450
MTYLVLSHPKVYKKLLAELEQAIPDLNNIPGVLVLEKLPYLYAVVKESLRYVYHLCHHHFFPS